MTIPVPFVLKLDFSTEGFANVWEAHAATFSASDQPEDAILSVEYMGLGPNSWPILNITFASVEYAKAYVHAYLGYDKYTVQTMDDVYELIQYGHFVSPFEVTVA